MATDAYEALNRSGKLSSHRVLSYRCRHRCLLLDVLRFPGGLIVASTRYKQSPARNAERSSAAGRARNTEDGDRRWRMRATFATDLDNAYASCDHLERVLTLDEIDADLNAGVVEVTIPR